MPNYKITNGVPIIDGYIQDNLYPIKNRNNHKYSTNPTNQIKVQNGKFVGKQARFTMVEDEFVLHTISTEDKYRTNARIYFQIGPNLVIATPDSNVNTSPNCKNGFIIDISNYKIVRYFEHPDNIAFSGHWFHYDNKLYTIETKENGTAKMRACVYDIKTDNWYYKKQAPVSSFAWASTAAQLYKNKIYVFGYLDSTYTPQNQIWCYNIDTDEWSYKGSLLSGTFHWNNDTTPSLSTPQFNGNYYYLDILYSSEFVKYDTNNDVVYTLPPYPGTIGVRKNVLTWYNKIFVSGYTDTSIYVFDMYKEIWSKLTDAPYSDAHTPNIMFIYNNKLFYRELYDTDNLYLKAYDMATEQWIPIETLENVKASYSFYWLTAIFNNKFFIIDPYKAPSANNIYELNLDTYTWRIKQTGINTGIKNARPPKLQNPDIFAKYQNTPWMGYPIEFNNKIILSGSSDSSAKGVTLNVLEWADHHINDYQATIRAMM